MEHDEEKLQVFVDGIIAFFNEFTRDEASVGMPYLMETRNPLSYDYSGIIGISGERKGSIYFTAPVSCLRDILSALGETSDDKESLMDLIGEIANTLAGNARKQFGERFLVSVPTVVSSSDHHHIQLPRDTRSYVIPIEWQDHQAALVITLT